LSINNFPLNIALQQRWECNSRIVGIKRFKKLLQLQCLLPSEEAAESVWINGGAEWHRKLIAEL